MSAESSKILCSLWHHVVIEFKYDTTVFESVFDVEEYFSFRHLDMYYNIQLNLTKTGYNKL